MMQNFNISLKKLYMLKFTVWNRYQTLVFSRITFKKGVNFVIFRGFPNFVFWKKASGPLIKESE